MRPLIPEKSYPKVYQRPISGIKFSLLYNLQLIFKIDSNL